MNIRNAIAILLVVPIFGLNFDPAIANPLSRLIYITARAKAPKFLRPGSSISHVRRLTMNSTYRNAFINSIENRAVAGKIQEAWKLTSSPSMKISLARQGQIFRSIEKTKFNIDSRVSSGNIASSSLSSKNAIHQAEEIYSQQIAKLSDELLKSVPISSFRTKSSLEKALRSALNKRAKDAKKEPSLKFEISSGKLSLPTIGQVGPLEIKGGSINAYNWIAGLSALIYCGKIDCIEISIKFLESNKVPPAPSEAESQEIIRRATSLVKLEEKLQHIPSNIGQK